MKDFQTEQETFWAGEFGNEYVLRNSEHRSVAMRTATFAKIISRTVGISSILELGTNIGQNCLALRNLLPDCKYTGVEINERAAARARQILNVQIHHGSIFEFSPETLGQHDLTLSAGVLIHINPGGLSDVYERLYRCSKGYICLSEYYNPSPVEVTYRGETERLFKRDFAGEMLDRYPDLQLVDYGFQYHRDHNFCADDATWFLLKKLG